MATTTQIAGVSWLNGHLWRDGETPPTTATVLHDRGFVLGDGLFETMLVRDGLPILWRAHIDRLLRTARVLHFPVVGGFDTVVREATQQLLCEADGAAGSRGTLRITLTRGSGTAYGLDAGENPSPTLLLRLTPALPRVRAAEHRETAWIVDQPRIDPGNVLSGHKTTSSIWRVVAHENARQQGAHLGLMKTVDGDIGEADTACLFAVIDDAVVTPPLTRGILPSTTRGFVVEQLAHSGHRFAERRIAPDELYEASEVLLTSSVAGIRALGAIDDRPLPMQAPLAAWLDELYERLPSDF